MVPVIKIFLNLGIFTPTYLTLIGINILEVKVMEMKMGQKEEFNPSHFTCCLVPLSVPFSFP